MRLLPLVLGLAACGGPDAGRPDRPDPTSSTTTTSTGTVVEVGEPVSCADPSHRAVQAFDRYSDEGGAWDSQSFLDVSDLPSEGFGVAAADFDGDGRTDLFVGDHGSPHLFLGTATGWTDADHWIPDPGALGGITGCQPVDLDGDGDLDLYLSRTLAPDTVLRNEGDGFTVGPPTPEAVGGALHGIFSSWADLDGDGDLDGYVGNYGEPHRDWEHNAILRNEDGVLVDASPEHPSALLVGHTFGGGWHDIDGDGRTDLYVVNDFGQVQEPNLAAFGDGSGTLSLAPSLQGLDAAMAGMGLGVGDLNQDGHADLLLSGWRRMRFLVSTGPALWVDSSSAFGFGALWEDDPDRRLPWGNELADLDNDGDLDAFVAFGYLRNTFNQVGNPFEQRDAVLLQGGDGTFTEVTDAWGLDSPGVSRGVVVADLDGNGWLDLLVQDLAGPPALFLARCGEASWVQVALRQDGPNPFAIGAEVHVEAGGQLFQATVRAGGTSLSSGGPPWVHLGLGELDEIDALEVRWPDGVVERFEGLPVRTRVSLSRPPSAP